MISMTAMAFTQAVRAVKAVIFYLVYFSLSRARVIGREDDDVDG
jgi:hypothetical protein